MEIEVGAILEGKVTGITKFGAFVALPGGKSGMVHISEIAPTFVREITDFVKEGQEVKVKVIKIDENGRIALSMKQTAEPKKREDRPFRPRSSGQQSRVPAEFDWSSSRKTEGMSFEDKMSKFKQDSDERMLDWKRAMDGRRGGRGGRGGRQK